MLDQTEVSGTITAVDPSGKISIATSRGPLDVWGATPVRNQFRVGTPVRVKTALQAVTFVPLNTGASPAAPQPAALAGGGPGDHAVIIGRILAVDPTGRLPMGARR